MITIQSKLSQIPHTRGASVAVAGVIRAEIVEGRLKPGERLLTLREICEISKLGYSTVNRAIAILVGEGLVQARKGAGTFVSEPFISLPTTATGEHLKVFALVIPGTEPGIYSAIQHGFGEAAAELQYQIMVCSTGESLIKQSDALMQLMDRSVAGIAIVPPDQPSQGRAYQIQVVQRANIPVVQLNRRLEGAKSPLISLSFSDLGAMAARVLANSGHVSVNMVGSHHGEVAEQYEAGFLAMYKRLGITPVLERCYSSYPDAGWRDEMRAMLDEILARPNRPTAFFALFDDVAEMIYIAATARGLEMPRDLSLISFGGSHRSGVLGGLISTVTGDEIWAGKKAVALLAEMCAGKRDIRSNEEVDIPLKFYEGETVGQCTGLLTENRQATTSTGADQAASDAPPGKKTTLDVAQ